MANGAAVAGTPRRIQHGIPRPDQVKMGANGSRASSVRRWYERKHYTGRLTPEQAIILEELIDDLERG